MPFNRSLGCRQTFGIKNKIAKTPANQFFHIFQTEYFRVSQVIAGVDVLSPGLSTLGWGKMILDKLRRLEWQLARTKRVHARNRKGLEKRKASREELISAGGDAHWAQDTIRHLIEGEKSSQLISRANRLGLPIPRYKTNESNEFDEDESWEVGYTGIPYLSRAAQFDLRGRIRQEEKVRREIRAFWVKDILVPVLSVLLGIIGATTGLIAILRK